MDNLKALANKIKVFSERVEEQDKRMQEWINKLEKPSSSIINQSLLLRAVIAQDSITNSGFENLPYFKESLKHNIRRSLDEEVQYLIEIRDKISEINDELFENHKSIENYFCNLRETKQLDISQLNPCCPSLEHVITWCCDIWRYYQAFYIRMCQTISCLQYEDENSVTALNTLLEEDPKLKKHINKIRMNEIFDLSVVEVKTSLCFNALDHPLKDGLYDLLMGPSGTINETCLTCRQTVRNCSGHFGHINLPLPVVNPLFHREVFTILKISCGHCFHLVIPSDLRNIYIHQMKLINLGRVTEVEELEYVSSVKDAVSNEALKYLLEDRLNASLKGLNGNLDPVAASRSIESLRLKCTNQFVKAIVLPKVCPHCKKPFRRMTSFQNKIIAPITKVEVAKKFKNSGHQSSGSQETVFITPKESREMLRKIWEEGKDLLEELMPVLKKTNLDHPTDLFYMDAVLVTPPKTRPVNILRDQIVENAQTSIYKSIINNCIIIKNLVKAVNSDNYDDLTDDCRIYVESIRGSSPLAKFHECWLQLQNNVNGLLDSSMSGLTSRKSIGLKQLMEKKEGILRMHMMGKRVNFAARSVITPDPNLRIEEIGVPEHFAKRLTYPTRVNFFNVEELRKMVENGPDVYPGATLVENENGSLIKLVAGEKNRKKRIGIAKLLLKSIESGGLTTCGAKKVHRHLLNGDILLLNRQPTLHRPSIMAHKAKILKNEKTLRVHYSNCKSYNADFDGDEMNLHLPQTELSRSEGYNIVNVNNHYLVPKDGTPLGGLIQDHIVSAVRLTVRGRFFDKEDYQQFVYQGLAHKPGNIILLPPCILKPKRLWSGKQIISTILINTIPKGKGLISFHGSSKINFKLWEKETRRPWKCGKEFNIPSEMSESEVVIVKGNLVSGVLDKQHFGAVPYGLTHCIYELYGGDCSSRFLDSIGKLATAYLQLHGFTLGVEDILVTSKADKSRKKIIQHLRKCGDAVSARALDLDEIPNDLAQRLEAEYFKDPIKFKAKLDQEYKKTLDSYTNDINKSCLPCGLICRFPKNNLQLMVTSGAKGSTVNTMQISCLLGQIELEGKRPPLMISGKSLPSYKAFETKPCAGGYIDNRFMTGICPQEFFFHCMAGREGLIDTAVKTSRSGYLQRCLIKHLEGVRVCYDGTVRDHDGTVIQFAYGGDGMEIQKSTFFKINQMNFLCENLNSIIDKSTIKRLKDGVDYQEIKRYREKLASWEDPGHRRVFAFTRFSQVIRDDISEKYFKKYNKATGRSKAYKKMFKKWNSLTCEERKHYDHERRPDPLTAKYNRNSDFGAITEKLEEIIQNYLRTELAERADKEKKRFRSTIEAKYMLSLCQPGEPVGILAAQSVGEPSTQMTLNTFHFAGRGEMNVTLGIPRLREILMTASKSIKTPYVDIPLKKKSEKKTAKIGKKLKKIFQRVTLADVLEKISVDEKLIMKPTQVFTYKVRFHFLPHDCYAEEFSVTPKKILAYIEKPFLISLCKEIRKLGKRYGDLIYETKEEKLMGKEDNEKDDEVDVDAADASERVPRLGEDHESSDEEEELDDDDATKAKLRGRHQENQDYDEPEESEEERSEEENEIYEKSETGGGLPEEDADVGLTTEELQNAEMRKTFILKTFPLIKSYEFDIVKEEWCEMVIGIPPTLSRIDFSTVLRVLCEKSVLHEVPNVKRAIVYSKDSGEVNLKTEGVNFIEMFKLDRHVDVSRLYSNDVHRVVESFGIEAGVRVIVKELNDVFGVYGITVDPRHLHLIADYMTNQGFYSPFNRTGLADSSSPLQQMSFESSTGFLKKSLVRRQEDNMESPSACIMAGTFCKSGTGCFDVMTLPSI
ncbi:hypothetical protein RUM43_013320 [Polyplax serrata]|uniref:DNA-directed RNA polymerase subunit n=1 Tax=Polyplax serrata TaxID=468196 RepID=A0AAN8P4Z0_POLSC